jgi:leader peptidase (prepilin peptidase) / N-methyltransferase
MQPIDIQPFFYFALGAVAIFGAVIGSFITLLAYRLPRGEKIGMTRSRCPRCNAVLIWRDLIPILSWLLARGHCRHCTRSISLRYPLTELACAMGAAAILAQQDALSLSTVALIGLWWVTVAIILTDLEHYLIPDSYQIALLLFGLLYTATHGADWAGALLTAAVGMVGGFAVQYGFRRITGRDGLGTGDIKLFGVLGFWLLTPAQFAPLLVYAGMLGIASALLWRMLGRGAVFPFAPAIMLALLLLIFCPDASATFWQLYGINFTDTLP